MIQMESPPCFRLQNPDARRAATAPGPGFRGRDGMYQTAFPRGRRTFVATGTYDRDVMLGT